MTTIERTLHVLIHDIRTPVGVAQGYLRLLQEDRLRTPEEKTRAITQAQQALDHVSRLCADATALAIDVQAPAAAVAVPAERFVDRLRHRLATEPVELAPPATTPGAIGVRGNTDALADAVARVLLSAPPDLPERRRTVAVGASGDELWFTSGRDHAGVAGEALDPWRGPGFALPLACQIITDAGGRVWTAGTGRTGTGVALPLEVTR